MATKTVSQLIDDVDGSVAARTITFAFDGQAYEIDLNAQNEANFKQALGFWIEHARRTASTRRRRSVGVAGRRRSDLDAIRAWANEHGYNVSSRGRVPNHIMAEYDAQH